jgi:hypothetical protein
MNLYIAYTTVYRESSYAHCDPPESFLSIEDMYWESVKDKVLIIGEFGENPSGAEKQKLFTRVNKEEKHDIVKKYEQA